MTKISIFPTPKFPSELVFIDDVFLKKVVNKNNLVGKFKGPKNRDFCEGIVFREGFDVEM